MEKKETLVFDNDIYNTIRKNIKKYRKLKGITAMELSNMVDLSHDFIRQIESEKTAYNFSVDTFYKISVALGVTLDDLIKKNDNDNEKLVKDMLDFLHNKVFKNLLTSLYDRDNDTYQGVDRTWRKLNEMKTPEEIFNKINDIVVKRSEPSQNMYIKLKEKNLTTLEDVYDEFVNTFEDLINNKND